jgi:hypothetical protein
MVQWRYARPVATSGSRQGSSRQNHKQSVGDGHDDAGGIIGGHLCSNCNAVPERGLELGTASVVRAAAVQPPLIRERRPLGEGGVGGGIQRPDGDGQNKDGWFVRFHSFLQGYKTSLVGAGNRTAFPDGQTLHVPYDARFHGVIFGLCLGWTRQELDRHQPRLAKY